MAQQLKTWMHWNAGKDKRMSTKPNLTWFNEVIGKSKATRAPQAIELYQQRNKKNIEQHVKEEIEETNAKTSKERMTIRRRIVAEMWDNEDDDVVSEIKEELDRQRDKGKDKTDEKTTEDSVDGGRSPEDYNKSVDHHSYL
jgi:hypothetical protein